ncbi:outer membrane lipoprotein-sorting protein [bacterium]|nr:outer membrane lipoprotein-sorting protein [bacterium]
MALLFAAPARAELSGKEIIAKSRDAQQTGATVNKIEMTLENKRGETLSQKLVTRTKTEGGLTRSVTTFLAPDETKGTKFLMVENAGRDDDMKIFIPDLKRIRTISTAQRNQSYMGTDFAFGDLEALDPDTGTHTFAGEETIDGAETYKVETTPDPNSGTGYAKMVNWIRKDNFIPVKTEYYDRDGNLKKVKTVHDVTRQGDGWLMKKMVMNDVQREHRTIIQVIDSERKAVDDEYFTERFLNQTDRY